MPRQWIVFVFIIFIACKKDDKGGDRIKSTSELVTEKQWALSDVGRDDNGNGVIEANERLLTDCEKGNTYVFNPDNTGSIQNNPALCNPPAGNTFTWELKNNDHEIVINQQGFFILRINENELILKYQLPGVPIDYLLLFNR
jgi:hypothetical protein